MKKIILTVIKTILVFTVIGQTYHPLIRPNTFWDEVHGNGSLFCNASGGDRYFFQGDTIILGNQYKQIRAFPMVDIYNSPGMICWPYYVDVNTNYLSFGLLREDTIAKKVYVFDVGNNADDLLYDFNLTIGDTIHSAYAGMGADLVIVNKSDTTLLNGAIREVFYLNNNEYYIESIGGSQGLFYPIQQGIGFWEELHGVIEDTTVIWGSRVEILGINEINNNENIEISPNFTSSEFYLKVLGQIKNPIELIIYDIRGKRIRQIAITENETIILINELPQGVYIINVVGNNLSTNTKLIKW